MPTTFVEVANGDVSDASQVNQFIGPINALEACTPWRGGTSGGSVNAYTVALDPPLTEYVDGQFCTFSPHVTNTGASTISVNGLGAVAIKLRGAHLAGGELTAGVGYLLVYASASNTWGLACGQALAALLGLADGGTGSNLSATGPGFLQQATMGAAVTVAALAVADLPGGLASPTNLYFPRGTGSGFSFRSPSQVLGDIGAAAASHTHAASDIVSGTIALARLAGITTAELSATAGIVSAQIADLAASKLTGLVSLARGGAGADLSATGGAHQVLRQSSAGAAITVSQLAASDISGLAASATTDTTDAGNISSGTLPLGRLSGITTTQLSASAGILSAQIASLAASKLTGQVAVATGGTGADLSATGGSGQVLKQSTVGGAVTVAALSSGDLPSHNHAGSDITSGQLAPARGGTGIDTSASTGMPSLSSGTWSVAAQVPLAKGGTNADLSATGGTSKFLKQASSGAAITVAQPTLADLAAGTLGTTLALGSQVVTNTADTTWYNAAGKITRIGNNSLPVFTAGFGFYQNDGSWAVGGHGATSSGDVTKNGIVGYGNAGDIYFNVPAGCAYRMRIAGSDALTLSASGITLGYMINLTMPYGPIDVTGGYILTSSGGSNPAASKSYINYDGTNTIRNSPSGKAILDKVAGTTYWTIGSTGNCSLASGKTLNVDTIDRVSGTGVAITLASVASANFQWTATTGNYLIWLMGSTWSNSIGFALGVQGDGKVGLGQYGSLGTAGAGGWALVSTTDVRQNVATGGTHSWRVNDVTAMSLTSSALTHADAVDLIFGSSTGSKIGGAGSKLAFYGATPIARPTTAIGSATFVGGGGAGITRTDTFGGYTLEQIAQVMLSLGFLT